MPIVDNELIPDDEAPAQPTEVAVQHETVSDWLFEAIRKNLEKYGDKTWMTDVCTGAKTEYSEVIPAVKRIASALHRRGLQPHDNFVILTTNFIEMPLTAFALFHLGACGVYLTQNIPQNDIKDRCLDMKPKFILTDQSRAGRVMAAVKDLDFVQEVFVIGQHEGCTPFTELINGDEAECPAAAVVDLKQAKLIAMYSSGTTGLPKAIIYTPYNLMGSVSISNTSFGTGRRLMFNNLIINSGGIMVLFVVTLHHNEGFVFSQFNDDLLVPAIDKYKPDIISAFPTQVAVICRTADVEKYDLSSVRIFCTGGSTMNPFYEHELFEKLPNLMLLFTGYGMTEAGMCVHNLPRPAEMRTLTKEAARKRHVVGSCGRVLPGCRLKIIDQETKEKLGPNQKGEICLKSPSIMKEYLNNEEATRNTIVDGWVHTGDQGYFDEEGNVFVTGRLKELIKYKMAHVVPANIEKFLLLHPDIVDAVVVGLPEDVAGELPLAFVAKREGSDLTEQQVIEFLEDKVADEEKLRGGVVFIDEIPRNDFRKPMRHLLVKRATEMAKTA